MCISSRWKRADVRGNAVLFKLEGCGCGTIPDEALVQRHAHRAWSRHSLHRSCGRSVSLQP
jgi:hypothetical protein